MIKKLYFLVILGGVEGVTPPHHIFTVEILLLTEFGEYPFIFLALHHWIKPLLRR
jgi:hypothetical protein